MGIVDQFASTVTNGLVVILAARGSSKVDFGHFSLAFTVAVLAMGLLRASYAYPLLLSTSDSRTISRRRVRAYLLATLVPGAGFAAAVSPMLGRDVALIALFGALVIAQDIGRAVAIGLGRPSLALISDASWLVAMLLGLLWLERQSVHATPADYLLLWLGSGAASAVPLTIGIWRLATSDHRSSPSLAPISWRWTVEFLLVSGSGQIAILALGALLPISAVGRYRAAYTIYGPLNTAAAAITTALAPRWRSATRAVRWEAVTVSGALAAFAAFLSMGFALGWLSPLATLFGETGEGLPVVAALLGVRYIFTMTCVGALGILRAAGHLQHTLPVLAISSIAQLIGGLAAAESAGIPGFLLVGAGIEGLAALALWRRLIRVRSSDSVLPRATDKSIRLSPAAPLSEDNPL